MGCIGLAEPQRQGEQSLETSLPSTTAASLGNQSCRSFKLALMNEILVFNTKKTRHCTLTSSPPKIKGNKETTQDFFLFPSICFASEVEEHGLFVHSPFKKTMSSLVKKNEENAKVSENDTLPGTYVSILY